jgi:glycosyltransferase involved in cell wall biosynthesis
MSGKLIEVLTPSDANTRRICFLLGSAALSGGTYVVFQHAQFLQEQGYRVTIAVQEPFDDQTTRWHDYGPKLHCVPFDDAKAEGFDLVIATWWKTALELGAFKASRYGYFVQSIESRFYSAEEVPLRALVDATYKLPVHYVTEASWIQDHLKTDFAQEAALVRNGIRKDIYRLDAPAAAPRPAGQPRVLVEGHFNVSFKNTSLAVKLARAAGARDIWVLTGSPIKYLPGISRIFSRVPIHETPSIYGSCDILLKLSTVEGMFGPPLEIFHCGGTALVFDVTGHDEYIRHNENAVVVRDLNTDKVVEELRSLFNDPARLSALKQGAQHTAAAWPDWQQSSKLFRNWVTQVLEGAETQPDAIRDIVSRAWKAYEVDEQARLKARPRVSVLQRLRAAALRRTPRTQERIKRLLAIAEVLSPSRRVH